MAGPGGPAASRPARPRWQVGLRSLGLLILAFSLWMTVVADRRQIARLESRIATLRPIARELVVDDPGRFAAVLRAPTWFDENGWDVYLPDGTYRLCLATREVDDSRPGGGSVEPSRLPPAVKSLPIGAGRHRVELDVTRDKGDWKVAFGVDHAPRMVAVEPAEWGSTSSSGGGEFSVSRQTPADRPLVLYRRQYMRPDGRAYYSTRNGPTEGILLWIERTEGPRAADRP